MEWSEVASSKRAALLNLILENWRLSDQDRPPPSQLKNVTKFIQNFLNPLELLITEATPATVIGNVGRLDWSVVEVTEAFCHRAALSHQLVVQNGYIDVKN
jgi:amidase